MNINRCLCGATPTLSEPVRCSCGARAQTLAEWNERNQWTFADNSNARLLQDFLRWLLAEPRPTEGTVWAYMEQRRAK